METLALNSLLPIAGIALIIVGAAAAFASVFTSRNSSTGWMIGGVGVLVVAIGIAGLALL